MFRIQQQQPAEQEERGFATDFGDTMKHSKEPKLTRAENKECSRSNGS